MTSDPKITSVQPYLVPADPKPDGWCRLRPNILVRIETECGQIGWGECYVSDGHEDGICSLAQAMGERLKGKTATNVRLFTHDALATFSNQFVSMDVASATSGIELAMWDVMGKWLGVPVYKMTGGTCHEDIPLYANMWTERPYTAEEAAEKALEFVAMGFKIVKFYPMWHARDDEDCITRVETVREAIGPDIGLAIDFVRRVMPDQVREICRRLEPTNLAWVEDPVPPYHARALKWLRNQIRQPLLAGESIGYKHGFSEIFAQGALDYINPDICAAGGFLEMREIAAMAQANLVMLSPHNYNSMTVGLSATCNLAAGIPNLAPVEYFPELAEKLDGLCTGRLIPKEGRLALPEDPGFGLTFDDSKMAPYAWSR